MSWTDLLIEMDVLFVLPALLAALVLAWHGVCSAARLHRPAEPSPRSESA